MDYGFRPTQLSRRGMMPVYEFTCQDCHKTFEVTRPMSEASAGAACPSCGSKRTERIWSSVSAVTAKKN